MLNQIENPPKQGHPFPVIGQAVATIRKMRNSIAAAPRECLKKHPNISNHPRRNSVAMTAESTTIDAVSELNIKPNHRKVTLGSANFDTALRCNRNPMATDPK